MQSQTVFNSQPKTLVIHWQTSFVYMNMMNTAHASDAGPGEMLTLWSGPSAPESCHEQKNQCSEKRKCIFLLSFVICVPQKKKS